MPARGAPTCRNDGRTGHGARLSHRTTTRPAQPSAHKHTVTPTTQSQDRHAHAVAVLGKKKLAKLTAKDVRTWLERAPHHLPVLRTRHRRPAQARPASPPALLRYRKVLPQAALAADAGLRPLRAQVRPGARRPRGGDPPQRRPQRPHRHTPPPPLRTPHRRRSPRVPHRHAGHRLQALFELALRTGLRKGELLGLRWEDLDLDGGTASIRRTLQRTNSGGLTALPTKTISSERRIALPTACLRSLRPHRDRQAREKQQAGAEWVDNGLAFTLLAYLLVQLRALLLPANRPECRTLLRTG